MHKVACEGKNKRTVAAAGEKMREKKNVVTRNTTIVYFPFAPMVRENRRVEDPIIKHGITLSGRAEEYDLISDSHRQQSGREFRAYLRNAKFERIQHSVDNLKLFAAFPGF